MDKDKFKLILGGLLEGTKKNYLEWEKTAEKETFLVSFEKSSISVSRSYGVDGGLVITFDFRDESGNLFESVIVISGDENWENALAVYTEAGKKATNIDEKIDDILSELENKLVAA